MEKKRTSNVLLAVMGVLVLCMLVVTICTIQKNMVTGICRLICLVFVTLYGFWFYKIPHNNLLKYAMFIAAAVDMINQAVYIAEGVTFVMGIIRLFVAAGLVYCAGRLDRIEQNRIILPLIDAVSLVLAIVTMITYVSSVGVLFSFRILGSTIMLTTLMIAYFVRYKEHKEAGAKNA